MTNQEKDIIRTVTFHLKDIYRNKDKNEILFLLYKWKRF